MRLSSRKAALGSLIPPATQEIRVRPGLLSAVPPGLFCSRPSVSVTRDAGSSQSYWPCVSRSRNSSGDYSDTLTLYNKELLLKFLRYLAVVSLLFAQCVFARADSLSELSDSFWQWRAQEQPFSDDDIPRIERPTGLVVDWSPQAITNRLQQLDVFEQRWKALAPSAQA